MNGIAGVVELGGAPVGVEVEGLVVSADVRLDDREALAAELGATKGSTDVELFARGYARWGARLPEHLLGDFAFAVWDPARRTLLCARDAFGVRPLAYARAGDRFAFASRPSALLALPWLRHELDELAIARYLVDDLSDPEQTFWLGIRRLPPGHLLEIVDGAVHEPRPYFRFDPFADAPAASPEEHAEAFRERFLAAVAWRLPAEGELGLEVSGGLDSASVAGAVRALGVEGSLPAYSVVFEGSPADERSYVEEIAAAAGLRVATLGSEELLAGPRLAELEPVLDSPYLLFPPLPDGPIVEHAAADGVPVLLTGFDGDTVVSHGLGRLTDLAVGGHGVTLARELRGLHRNLGWGRWPTFRSEVLGPLAPAWVHRARSGPRDPLAGTPIDRDLARRVGLLDRLEEPPRRGRPYARREHFRDLTSAVNSAALEVLDHAAARAGVELRHPFFDRRLAELSLSLPGDAKLRDGWPRWVQRRAMQGLVPERVRWRPDKGVLGPTVALLFLRREWDEATRLVAERGGAAAPYVDAHILQMLYDRASEQADPEAASGLWDVLLLERWLLGLS